MIVVCIIGIATAVILVAVFLEPWQRSRYDKVVEKVDDHRAMFSMLADVDAWNRHADEKIRENEWAEELRREASDG